MTYSIVARDAATGEMGLATQSQAFAVGSSVPWAEPGFGVIATQSVAEPFYGELGLDLLRGGMTATEALTALRSVDPHPERRQVAMIDADGDLAAYTGDGCVEAAGHLVGEGCCALANMVASGRVWEAMVERYQSASGSMARRLVCALEAAEEHGGDVRGQRSAAVMVVRAERTGRPWRDRLADLRVDDHADAVGELSRLLDASERYHRSVRAFELALDGDPAAAVTEFERLEAERDIGPDGALWKAMALTLDGREDEAADTIERLRRVDPRFVEAFRRFGPAGLVPEPEVVERVFRRGGG